MRFASCSGALRDAGQIEGIAMLYTTLDLLHERSACVEYNEQFARLVGLDLYEPSDPIPLTRLQAVNGLEFALWCLQATTAPCDAERIARLLACDYAEHVLPVWARVYEEDPRLAQAIETARKFVRGEATSDDLVLAQRAVEAAAWHAKRAVSAELEVQYAIKDVAEAAFFCTVPSVREKAYRVAEAAVNAVGWSSLVFDEDDKSAAELAWQIKRFTELLEED